MDNVVSIPETAKCYIEVRDVSIMDAPSVTLRSVKRPVKVASNGVVADTAFDLTDKELHKSRLDVWAHISLTGVKRIRKGDFLTVASYPINQFHKPRRMDVVLKQI